MSRHTRPFFYDRGGVEAGEVAAVDAAADEAAPFVEAQLVEARVARADFEAPEAQRAGRAYGVVEQSGADAAALEGRSDGEAHDFGREGAACAAGCIVRTISPSSSATWQRPRGR